MLAVLGALLAGALTTLAPCVLPLLPVIVGGAATEGVGESGRLNWVGRHRRALVITGSLGLSITLFTLALKASTALLLIPTQTWSILSGMILVLLGVVGAFPDLWESVSARLSLQGRSDARLRAARARGGATGDVLTGAALGPVFSSCSPLYAYVVVTVLPARFGYGMVLLAAYVLGLCATLLAIALAGRSLVARLGWAADSHGRFRRILGAVFIVVGVGVALGWDRDLQAWILEHSPIAPWELDSGFIPAGA
ncbi:MAG: cytochrome c biogenesis protein CcdA [Candidatus Phosphoribacter sp.]|nr:cytochrome C biogenesis protein [Actinomycetales bacterium]